MLLSWVKNYLPMLVGGVVIAGGVVAGSLYLGARSVDHLIETSAQSRAGTFADFLLTDRARLDTLLHGISRDPELETTIRTVAALAHLSAFAVFDREGRETFTTRSEQMGWLLRNRPGGLSTGSRLSEETLRRPDEWVDMVESNPSRPTVIMPLYRDGAVAAYLSTEVDMTGERLAYVHTLFSTTLQFAAIVLLATGLPILFYLRRRRRILDADERIKFLHNHDALTNLLNRRRMHEEADRKLANLRATRERMALWFLDIDALSEINDSLGQSCGDELLQVVAGRLTELVDPNDLIARLGSDDFAILQRNVRSEDALRTLAHRILVETARPLELAGQIVHPRVTLGVAFAPDHGRTYAEIIRHAELAFLHQKSLGRGEYTLFQSWMDEEAHRRRAIEQMLRAALENDGFELFYQPIVAGDCETLVGFEALIRMPDGEGGHIPPAAFIPVAEAKGYIKAIGTWVIGQACRQAAAWPDHLFVSVNLSAVQFRDGDIVDITKAALADAGISGKRLGIEVVESLLLDQTDEILDQLCRLRELGVSVDMDDFGTGYSSLSYLWRFPFDKLKIDQSFMQAFHDGRSGASHILETIISLAHHLGLKVTAEGIETREQAELLRSFGCDQLQGYHFGRPRPPSEVAAELLKATSTRLIETGTTVGDEREAARTLVLNGLGPQLR